MCLTQSPILLGGNPGRRRAVLVGRRPSSRHSAHAERSVWGRAERRDEGMRAEGARDVPCSMANTKPSATPWGRGKGMWRREEGADRDGCGRAQRQGVQARKWGRGARGGRQDGRPAHARPPRPADAYPPRRRRFWRSSARSRLQGERTEEEKKKVSALLLLAEVGPCCGELSAALL